jgi:hypothetical protein
VQSPEDARKALATRFARQHRRWFSEAQPCAGEQDAWPLTHALGRPTEQDFITDPARVREWVSSWERFSSLEPEVCIEWGERQWPRLGRQRLPERLVLRSAEEVASLVGAGKRWRRACSRAGRLAAGWPVLSNHAVLGRVFDAMADYADDDFERLLALLKWTDANPASGLYLRQLPIAGLDTKWISARSTVCTELLRSLRLAQGRLCEDGDLHALLGLKRSAARIRVRLLCPSLRRLVGGLEDMELPVAQLAALDIAPRTVLIAENLETGQALPDMAGTVAVMKLGAAVKLIAELPWITRATCLYWGDIDTFGFEILHRARCVVPHLRSVLMDSTTLLDHRALWVNEPTQATGLELPLLTADEREVFEGLRANRWGENLRLEQERIPWTMAMNVLLAATGNSGRA